MLTSLSSFIRRAVSPPLPQSESTSSFWYMASSFATPAEFLSTCSLIRPRHSIVSEDSINDIEWSNTVRQSNTEDFVGTFDCAWSSRISNEFSLGELGDVGQVVETLMRESSSASQSKSTTSRMAVSVNPSDPSLTKLTSLLCSV